MSTLMEHAKRELDLVNKFNENKEDEYSKWIDENVLELINMFAKQGHSGMSAALVINIFSRLAKRELLTPITSNPEEWFDVSKFMRVPCWQNIRDTKMLSRDGGQTWYNVHEQTIAKEQ